MKFSAFITAAACLVSGSSTHAFSTPKPAMTRTNFGTTRYMAASSDGGDEVSRLRAAAAAAREEAARLSKELGRDDSKSATPTIPKSTKSPEEIADTIRTIDFQAGPSQQIATLDTLRNEGAIKLYKSAVESGDLRDFELSLSQLESRTGLTAEKLGIGEEEVSLDDFKFATLYVTGGCSVVGVAALAFLPENVGATVCYLVAVIPVLFLAVGSTAPAAIANVLAGLKGSEAKQQKAERVCRHEAAHFLCGYLCGLPVASYATTENENVPRVEFYNTRREEPITAQQELSDEEVNTLAVVALSGAVAEAMEFGTAGGGSNADLLELEMTFRRSANFVGAVKQQNLTRWGALTAHRLLSLHRAKLDKLVEAFSARKTVAECMSILEQ